MSRLKVKEILRNSVIAHNSDSHRKRKKKSEGIDIAIPYAKDGARLPVRTPIAGKITLIGRGLNTVEITDRENNRHRLIHFSKILVRLNDIVFKRQIIGLLGKKGATKDHVHYQIHYIDKRTKLKKFIDPEKFDFPLTKEYKI